MDIVQVTCFPGDELTLVSTLSDVETGSVEASRSGREARSPIWLGLDQVQLAGA